MIIGWLKEQSFEYTKKWTDIIKCENIPNSVKRASGVTIYNREKMTVGWNVAQRGSVFFLYATGGAANVKKEKTAY